MGSTGGSGSGSGSGARGQKVASKPIPASYGKFEKRKISEKNLE